ncbi:MAG: penicillin-binding transpeptidase domain-containing protein [Bacteroidota bacterium]
MNSTNPHSGRVLAIRVLFGIILIGFLIKAAQLQLFKTDLSAQAERIGRTQETQYPSRGLILDRNGALLAANEPSYQIELTYEPFAAAEHFDTLEFCRLLDTTVAYFEQASQKDWNDYRYSRIKPFVFLRDISPRVFATFQERMHEFPGFTASLRSRRTYSASVGAHLLGFMGEVNQEQVKREGAFYSPGDYRGASGLEYRYEFALRGQKGKRQFLVDNRGRKVEQLFENEDSLQAVAGANLRTTIDLDLQAYGEQLMVNKVGSIVAIEPNSGEILAMISAPSYEPNELEIGKFRGQAYNRLAQDSLQPLLNRAVSGKYPPGSPFKTLVGLIGLQDGTIRPNQGMACQGGFFSNGQLLTGCHSHPYCRNVEDAIAHSCNNYFVMAFLQNLNREGSLSPYKTLGTFNDYLYQFGLANRTGIDLPGEQAGFVPDSAFISRSFASERFWRAIYIRSLAIGQGEYELTTLQLANLSAAIGNRGYWITPHLVKEVEWDIDSINYFDPELGRNDIDIDREHFETVISGMRGVLTKGTARSAEVPGLDICGKTGTAENGTAVDHSIFVAFAPKDDPQIAIAVYVEYGGFGTTYAAPIASLMIEKYLRGEISPTSQWRENRLLNTNLLSLRP